MESKTSVDYRKTAETSSEQHSSTDHAGTHSRASISSTGSDHIEKKGASDGASCYLETSEQTLAISSEQQWHQLLKANGSPTNSLVEVNILKEIRQRSFSHWSYRLSPSDAQMIQAGFFACNVGDRVICLYCNLICQQWTPRTDDPCEVHKTLSPKCPYVTSVLCATSSLRPSITNENSTTFDSISDQNSFHITACNRSYSEGSKRAASFSNWSNEKLPSVNELVKAGFFYIGTNSIVTCFYCNGSLQNWGANDNPMIEHVRWFPHCEYARQLCGANLCGKIEEAKRIQREKAINPNRDSRSQTEDNSSNDRRLMITDESTLSRYVAARLDLPKTQKLLDHGFKLCIIRRCWEDQLRLKQDDFKSDCDLFMACMILQRQIEHIDGKKENIIVPSVRMREIHEQHQPANDSRCTTNGDSRMQDDSQICTRTSVSTSMEGTNRTDTNQAALRNLCVLCVTEERRLALLPCAHDYVNNFNQDSDQLVFRETPNPVRTKEPRFY